MNTFIGNIIDFLLAFMEVGLGYIIACNTIIERKSLKKSNICILIVVCVILSVMLTVNREIAFMSYIMMIFCVLVTALSIWLTKKSEFLLSLGVAFTYYLAVSFCEMFLAFISMMFLKKEFDKTIFYLADSIWKNVIYFLSGIVIVILLFMYRRKQKDNYIDLSPFKKLMIIINLILYVVFRQYLALMNAVALGEQEMMGIGAGFSLLAIISVVGLASIGYLKYRIVQEENRNYLVRDEIYKRNFDDMDQLIKINGQRLHDVKNHFVVIKELCIQKNLSGIETYVDDICEEYFNQSYQVWTGNRIIDIILNQKKEIAERKGIDVHIDAVSIPEIRLNDIEICSLLGNLIDNAIEACEKQGYEHKFIDIKIQDKKGFLFITIKNSIHSKPKIEKGVFITSKEDKITHGYGLKSVNRIVKKYEGDISYTIEEETFEIRICFYDMVLLSD